MAFDQNSIPKDLRPLNIIRNVVEEPRIAPATASRGLEGYFPNLVREIGSPEAVPVYYPAAVPVSDAGIVGLGYGNAPPSVAAWGPRVAVPVAYPSVSPAVGYGYGPTLANRVAVGGSGDLVSSTASTASGGSPNLGNLVGGSGADLATHDMAVRTGYTSSASSRVAGNASDQIVNDPPAGSGNTPNLSSQFGGNAIDQASDEGGDDSVSGKKVKFLCSFGGKIFPRPGDGVLRYVGGHTRIISVKRDLSFNELVQKMVDTYGQPVVIKYQLPDEDLDALVSVSCPDDLDNMMDEYEKLSEMCPDGSAKLRVFLFSASELDPTGMVQFGDLHDGGQRYVDAVNGIGDGLGAVGSTGGGGITRKESMASATSTQNSEYSGSEAVDNSIPSQADVTGPVSTNIQLRKQNSGNSDDVSPRLVGLDSSNTSFVEASGVPSRVPTVKSGPSQSSSPHLELESERSIPMAVAQQQLGLQQPGMEIPTPAYVHAYVDPRQEVANQADYLQLPPQMGFPNPQLLGTAGPMYTPQQLYGNGAGVVARQFMPGVCTTVNPSSSHVGIRKNMVQQIIQPQQARLDTYVDERAFGPRVVQLPVEQSYNSYQVQVPLPVVGGNYAWHQVPTQEHIVFSDDLLPRQQVMVSEKIPRFVECFMCQKALPHAHSDTVIQGQRDSGASSLSDSNPTYHSLHLDDHLRAQPSTRIVASGAHGDPQIGSLQPETSTFVPHPETKLEKERINIHNVENVEHHRISAPQAVMVRTTDIQPPNSAFMSNIPQSVRDDPVQQHPVPAQYLVKQDALNKPVARDMLPVGGIPVQTSERLIHESPKSPTDFSNKFHGIAPKEDAIETCVSYDQMRPIEGRMEALRICSNGMSVSNEQSRLPVDKFEASHGIPNEVLPCSSTELPNIPTSRLVESYEVAQPPIWGNPASYGQARAGGLPLDYNEVQYGNPPFPGMVAPSSFTPSSRTADVQDSSHSLFSNQDPWNLRHDSHFPPPRPNKSPSKKELSTMEDGAQQSLGNLNKDQSSEQVQSAKGLGSAEEQIRNDLQSVAEGVAASVFQSATASNPNLHDRNELANESIQDRDVENKVEDVKTKIPERVNVGFPVSDGIGRLQIIKNSDLEELRELGSGTFGTVYHGKWRGTDVAIKRINDRCFAGKPSEQERMRDDFWNEAIKLADLHHPNVLAFYGVVLDGPGGSVATVTEYMVNGSLRNALQKSEKSLDKRMHLLIAMDVAFGMEYLHGKNIVHFDLKSDNLLVNLRDPHRPICKVGDLGLSKVKCQTLISGGVRGTLPWMAPELLNGSSSLVSEKVDVFSFGIVMWELLTGEEPYADLHYGAIIGGIVNNTLRPPIPEFCDPEWKSLMERCWSSEPCERPSFIEIANKLRAMAAKIPPKGHSQQQAPTTQPPV